jgi:hypothetical protein
MAASKAVLPADSWDANLASTSSGSSMKFLSRIHFRFPMSTTCSEAGAAVTDSSPSKLINWLLKEVKNHYYLHKFMTHAAIS